MHTVLKSSCHIGNVKSVPHLKPVWLVDCQFATKHNTFISPLSQNHDAEPHDKDTLTSMLFEMFANSLTRVLKKESLHDLSTYLI